MDTADVGWKSVRPLAEITAIENAYLHGVPSLGHAAAELLRRWHHDLRDAETLIRLIFLAWYQRAEPTHLTGLGGELPSPDCLISEVGGDASLDVESRFVVGYLARLDPHAMGGSNWEERAEALLTGAASSTSALFADWRIFFESSAPVRGRKLNLVAEVRARFAGRGAMGDYFVQVLTSAVGSAYRREGGGGAT